ncbi:MAG: hypothetical protein NTW29_15050 [Bacteroidetes bacterium]|nr:hypothetical protein [Bacteroidota bacterium]
MKKIFFAYSDNAKDVELYREFNKHFKTYARNGLVMLIDKDELFRQSGDSSKADQFLLESDITVPLLSVDYLDNEQCLKLIDVAVAGKKPIIPILLRDCNFDSVEKLKALKDQLLPDDKEPVMDHMEKQGGQDEVFAAMARRVKGVVLKELESVVIKKSSGRFYYILAGILLVLGGLAASYSYTEWADWRVTTGIFLLFLIIALFALKDVLFPTKFKVG